MIMDRYIRSVEISGTLGANNLKISSLIAFNHLTVAVDLPAVRIVLLNWDKRDA